MKTENLESKLTANIPYNENCDRLSMFNKLKELQEAGKGDDLFSNHSATFQGDMYITVNDVINRIEN